jgi:hypothetical protein
MKEDEIAHKKQMEQADLLLNPVSQASKVKPTKTDFAQEAEGFLTDWLHDDVAAVRAGMEKGGKSNLEQAGDQLEEVFQAKMQGNARLQNMQDSGPLNDELNSRSAPPSREKNSRRGNRGKDGSPRAEETNAGNLTDRGPANDGGKAEQPVPGQQPNGRISTAERNMQNQHDQFQNGMANQFQNQQPPYLPNGMPNPYFDPMQQQQQQQQQQFPPGHPMHNPMAMGGGGPMGPMGGGMGGMDPYGGMGMGMGMGGGYGGMGGMGMGMMDPQMMAYQQQQQMMMDNMRMQQEMEAMQYGGGMGGMGGMGGGGNYGNRDRERDDFKRELDRVMDTLAYKMGGMDSRQPGDENFNGHMLANDVGRNENEQAGAAGQAEQSLWQAQKDALKALSTLPKDSPLYQMQMEHLEYVTKLHFEADRRIKEDEVENLKSEIEQRRREREAELEKERARADHRNEIAQQQARKQRAKENFGEVLVPVVTMESYDPSEGIALYFDFITNVPSRFRRLSVLFKVIRNEFDTTSKGQRLPFSSTELDHSSSNRMAIGGATDGANPDLVCCVHSGIYKHKPLTTLPSQRLVVEVHGSISVAGFHSRSTYSLSLTLSLSLSISFCHYLSLSLSF